MRNMSFSLTIPQIINHTKDVTRRVGWKSLKPGDHFLAVEKAMGLKKGEQVQKICELICISERWEPLRALTSDPEYGKSECTREGFPNLDPWRFGIYFIRNNGLGWNGENYNKAWGIPLHRIEFAYVNPNDDKNEMRLL